MKRLLPLIAALFCVVFASAQTTHNFATSPTLTNPVGFPSNWKTDATITVDGVQYLLSAGGNGTWAYLSTGGNSNSACIRKDGAGDDQLTIKRVDGKPFQFYALWFKYQCMYDPTWYKPPYYRITYNKADGTTKTYTHTDPSQTGTSSISEDISVTSVAMSITGLLYMWVDDLRVGPAALPLSATIAKTNAACKSSSTGTATVTPGGGTAPYTYSWSPSGGTAATATGLAAGTYTCTITDAALATVTKSTTVGEPASVLTASSVSQTNLACHGASTGSASVSAGGGTSPYTYSWSPSGGTAATATGLSAGTYACTVTDSKGCTATQSFTLTQPASINITAAAQTNIACNGASNGSASINLPTGGYEGYTYNWTPGNPTGDGTRSVSGLAAGTYQVTVTDEYGCSASLPFTITQPLALNVTAASQTNIACNGGTSGAATINLPTGGTASYTYNWTPGNPTGDGTRSVSALSAGTYNVTVTDANSCTSSKSFTITEPSALTAETSQTNVTCKGGTNGTARVTVSGGSGSYYYSWSPSGGNAAQATGLSAGTYTCTITDVNECSITKNVVVTEPASSTISFEAHPQNKTATAEGLAQFSATVLNATTLQWQVNMGEGFFNISNGEQYSGVTTATLNVSGVTNAMNGYLYRCVASSICFSNITSNAATLSTKSSNAYLENLKLYSATLSPEFSSEYFTYSSEVSSSTSSVELAPLASHSGAIVKVNGQSLSDGYSIANLQPGSNTFTILVTAEDGETTKEYIIKIFRAYVNVSSIERTSAQYTKADEVTFSVQFDGEINDLSTSNLSLATTGSLQGYSIESVSKTGEGLYNVTVNTGTGNGTIKLTVANTEGLSSPLQELPYTGKQEYIIDRTAPVAAVKNITVTLGNNGHVSVTPSQVNNGSSDEISDTELLTYSLSQTDFTSEDLGTRTVKFKVTDQAGNSTEEDVVITITKNINQVSALPVVKIIYGDQLQLPELAIVTYSDMSSGNVAITWNTDSYTGKKGEYTVYGTLSLPKYTSNSESLRASITIEVGKRPLLIQLVGEAEKIYNGNTNATMEQDNYQSDKLEGDDIIFLGFANYNNKNVGTEKKVTVSEIIILGEDANNYELTSSTIDGNIGKINTRTLDITLKGTVNKTYDGKATATLAENNFGSNALEMDDVSFTATAEYDNKNAGEEKTVTASAFIVSGEDAQNYNLETVNATTTGNIYRKEISASAIATPIIEKTYDGSAEATLADGNYQLNNTIEGDEVNVAGIANYDNKRAGKNKEVYVTELKLHGTDKQNYLLTTYSLTTIGNINGKTIDASFNSEAVVKKIYDANTNAEIPDYAYHLSDIVGNDDVKLNNPAEGNYDNKHAGDNKIVTATGLEISGEDADNYLLASATVSGEIGKIIPKPVYVTADEKIKVYGSQDPLLTYQVEGLVEDETLEGNLSRAEGKNVGHYAIQVGSLNGGTDYIIENYTGSELMITPAELMIGADDKKRKQGASNPELTLSYTGLATGDSPNSLITMPVVTTEAIAKSPIGYYDINVSGAASPNYTITYAKGMLTVIPSEEKPAGSLKAWSSGPGTIQVRIYAEQEQDAAITLYTELGQPIVIHKKHLQAGINDFTLPSWHLASSNYVLSVWAQKFKVGEKVQVK